MKPIAIILLGLAVSFHITNLFIDPIPPQFILTFTQLAILVSLAVQRRLMMTTPNNNSKDYIFWFVILTLMLMILVMFTFTFTTPSQTTLCIAAEPYVNATKIDEILGCMVLQDGEWVTYHMWAGD